MHVSVAGPLRASSFFERFAWSICIRFRRRSIFRNLSTTRHFARGLTRSCFTSAAEMELGARLKVAPPKAIEGLETATQFGFGQRLKGSQRAHRDQYTNDRTKCCDAAPFSLGRRRHFVRSSSQSGAAANHALAKPGFASASICLPMAAFRFSGALASFCICSSQQQCKP
jgi:hypothetical protein